MNSAAFFGSGLFQSFQDGLWGGFSYGLSAGVMEEEVEGEFGEWVDLVGQFGEEEVKELADLTFYGGDLLRERFEVAGQECQALTVGVWLRLDGGDGLAGRGEEKGDVPGVNGVSFGGAQGEGGSELLDAQGVEEVGLEALVLEVAHKEGGIRAAGFEGNDRGGVWIDKVVEIVKALAIERERVDGEGIFIWEEDSGGEGIFADINAYEFLGGHIHHLL